MKRPDLHELIRMYGAYSRIPPAAWADYDCELEAWKAELRWRGAGADADADEQETTAARAPARSDEDSSDG